jgi:hypothetical protein
VILVDVVLVNKEDVLVEVAGDDGMDLVLESGNLPERLEVSGKNLVARAVVVDVEEVALLLILNHNN